MNVTILLPNGRYGILPQTAGTFIELHLVFDTVNYSFQYRQHCRTDLYFLVVYVSAS